MLASLRPIVAACQLAVLTVCCSAAGAEDSAFKGTVRDVNVYVTSSYGFVLNHRDLYRSTLPGFASPKRTTAERKHLLLPSPTGLITFEGQPSSNLDVLLEFENGRFFAAWPPAAQRSKRLLWARNKLSLEQGTPPVLPEGHWLSHLRNTDRLWIDTGRRNDRFILYDCELQIAPSLKVSSAEGGYGLTNLGRFTLHNLTVYRPQETGWVSASLDKLETTAKKEEKKPATPEGPPSPEAVFEDGAKPAEAKPAEEKPAAETPMAEAKPADVKTEVAVATEVAAAPAAATPAGPATIAGAPGAAQPPGAQAQPAAPAIEEKVVTVQATKEPQSKEQISAAWRQMLSGFGLGEPEIAHVVAILEQQALRKDSATVVFRLDDEQLDSLLPLEVTPTPDKQIRVAMVVLLDADPDLMLRVDELVKQLGAPSYTEREAAAKRLRQLGPAAKQKLQEAVNNADPEISFRAEEIIEGLDNPQAGAAGAPGAMEIGI